MDKKAPSRRRSCCFRKFGRLGGEKRRHFSKRYRVFSLQRAGCWYGDDQGMAMAPKKTGMMIIPVGPCGPLAAGAGGMGGGSMVLRRRRAYRHEAWSLRPVPGEWVVGNEFSGPLQAVAAAVEAGPKKTGDGAGKWPVLSAHLVSPDGALGRQRTIVAAKQGIGTIDRLG